MGPCVTATEAAEAAAAADDGEEEGSGATLTAVSEAMDAKPAGGGEAAAATVGAECTRPLLPPLFAREEEGASSLMNTGDSNPAAPASGEGVCWKRAKSFVGVAAPPPPLPEMALRCNSASKLASTSSSTARVAATC